MAVGRPRCDDRCHDGLDGRSPTSRFGEPAVETELTAEEAAPLLGTSAETLVMLIEAGAGWRYFRSHRGLETRAADGTVVGLQPLTPEGDRFGPAVAIFNERDDL